jgi:hypothetical protein
LGNTSLKDCCDPLYLWVITASAQISCHQHLWLRYCWGPKKLYARLYLQQRRGFAGWIYNHQNFRWRCTALSPVINLHRSTQFSASCAPPLAIRSPVLDSPSRLACHLESQDYQHRHAIVRVHTRSSRVSVKTVCQIDLKLMRMKHYTKSISSHGSISKQISSQPRIKSLGNHLLKHDVGSTKEEIFHHGLIQQSL